MAVEKDLYDALMAKDFNKVSRLCHDHPEHALLKISIYNDTALHMAAHSKEKHLLLELLKMLPADYNSQLSGLKNADGNTVLHEVAASDAMKGAAEELLKSDPNLITQTNELGEKPIFCAGRYGQIGMFEFLADKMELKKLTPEETKAHLQRNDGKTVLHISIAAECFELSLLIAEQYPILINERDESSMTALQYLACNPTAFKEKRGFIQNLIKVVKDLSYQLTQEGREFLKDLAKFYDNIFNKDLVERKRRLRHLVFHLVKHETSWNTDSEVMGSNVDSKKTNMETKEAQCLQESLKSDESPLFLATMSNISVIVEEILKLKPNALKHTNEDGMNILHMAILYRNTDIFDMVIGKYEVLGRRLLLANDNKGNSVLHMVSLKRKGLASEEMRSPAFQLRSELLLFETVKAVSKTVVRNSLNNDNKTAEELFVAANEQLLKEAKKWIISAAQNCILLSVFIATVAFAAAYTVPGGPDQDTGDPMLRSKPFFAVFILADITSTTLALISLSIFLSILISSFSLQDFEGYLFQKLAQGIICLIISVTAMAVEFGATIVLMMASKREKVVWDAVAFLPVLVFFLSYATFFLDPCLCLLQNLTFVCMSLIWFIPFIIQHLILYLFIIVHDFIHKHVLICKSGNQSQPISDTPSPHPTSDTSLHQV